MGVFSKLFGLNQIKDFLDRCVNRACVNIVTNARINESYSEILSSSELRLLSKAVTPFVSPCKILIGGKRPEGISNLSSVAEQIHLEYILMKIGGRLVHTDKEISEFVIDNFCGTSRSIAVVLHWWRTNVVMWYSC